MNLTSCNNVYTTKDPYIFISYSHKDNAVVLPIIHELQKQGFRIWYDEEIELGAEWPEYIAHHLFHSSCVLIFITENLLNSPYCNREINFAIDKKKNILCLYMENFELPLGLQMQLSTLQSLYFWKYTSPEYFLQELSASALMQICRKCAAADTHSPQELYEHGNTCFKEHNFKEAFRCYREAAIRGHVSAQNNLGYCFFHGKGTEQNFQEAIAWWRKAAENGNKEAANKLKSLREYLKSQ